MNKVFIAIGSLVFIVTGLVALVSIHRGSGLVVPGFPAVSYSKDELVPLKVNKITSHHTQVPFAYFTMDGVCKTNKTEEPENIGDIIMGDVSIEHSGYKIPFQREVECERVCQAQKLTPEQVAILRQRVRDEYKVHWTLDGLPAAHQFKTNSGDLRWETGFPLGKRENAHDAKAEKQAVLFNHAHITIHYTPYESKPGEGEKFRIVFFQVTPGSVNYAGVQDWKERCAQRDDVSSVLDLQQIGKDQELDLTWSYSVEWKAAVNSTWATRWENYIKMQKGEREVHWFSIINSFLIVLFLTGMVAMIMLRTLNADFRRYNSQDPEEADETGWKLVHADVFRPPQRPMLFSALVGNGVQVIGMLVVTMVFAVLGFLSPANHGLLLTAGLVLYVWMGTLAGYFSTRVYKTLKGQNWQKNTVLTAVAFPGVIFGVYFFLNFFLWGQHSSRAIPFGTLVVLIVFWFGISVPLAFFGAYFAWKKPAPDQPVRVNQIPRQVPQQVWYMHPLFSVLLGGILPFGAVFIELFFILASIWLDQVYYLFSFLFIVFIILCITCAEISIVMCYFQLCSEDYHWWWRSYLTSGASALYMFLYSLFYFTTKLEFSSVLAALLYFGYSFIMSLIFFVLTGTIGYYSCYWFVRKIYSSVKFE